MGENCTALFFVDVAAFRIELHGENLSHFVPQIE